MGRTVFPREGLAGLAVHAAGLNLNGREDGQFGGKLRALADRNTDPR